MITNMNEQQDREARAAALAAQVAALLNEIQDLGAGQVVGQLTVPGARIRQIGTTWEVTR